MSYETAADSSSQQITLRHATEFELPFVRGSWLQSFASSSWAEFVTPKSSEHMGPPCNACGTQKLRCHRNSKGLLVYEVDESFVRGHKALIGAILERANVTVAVAEDGLVEGWIVRQYRLVHYMYVRHDSRRAGLAKRLAADLCDASEPVTFSHWSRGLQTERLPAHWHYDPYAMVQWP